MDEIKNIEPLVSVIIPFFSGRTWLEEALKSCFNQTYINMEIILLNDGSSENIDDILSLYKNKIRYYFHDNIGAAATRNKGIKYAVGEFIAFLDSDDIWYIDKLKVQIDALLMHDYEWCHCSYELFEDNTNRVIKRVLSGKLRNDCFSKFNYVCLVATPTVIIKREIFLENEFSFNESLKYGEDVCLWVQIASKYPLWGIDDVLVKVRLHGNNAAKNIDAQITARGSYLEFVNKNSYELCFVGRKTYQYCSWLKQFCGSGKISSALKYVLFFPAWAMFKILNKLY